MNRFFILVVLTVIVCAGAYPRTQAAAHTTTSELSAQTLVALRSNDYVTVGTALFSAQSQADIDALDEHFQRLLARELSHTSTTIAYLPPTISQRLTAGITGSTTYKANISARTMTTLTRGDIILRRSHPRGCAIQQFVRGCRAWAAVYDHAALYYGRIDGVPMVYESHPQRGVRLVPLSNWLRSPAYVGIYRLKTSFATHANMLSRFVIAYGTNGRTRFNATQTDKTSDTRVSSAQLVWLYYRTIGVNVDSNNTLYAYWLRTGYSPLVASYIANHAVAPDEIALSPALTRVAHGWLP
jgi:hypothetical protein